MTVVIVNRFELVDVDYAKPTWFAVRSRSTGNL